MSQHSKTAKDDIAVAAYRLFLQAGYSATSYRDIAAAVGKDRTIVQYHYPQKDALVVTMLNRVVALIEERVTGSEATGAMEFRVRLAQLYFAFLLQPDIRQFTLDVLSSRAITRQLAAFDADWNADFLGVAAAERRAVVQRGILAIGGAHELIYHSVLSGEPLDATALAGQTVQASLLPEQASDDVDSSAGTVRVLDDAELAEAVRHVRDALLVSG